MTAKEIVLFFLVLIGVLALARSLLVIMVLGMEEPESAIGAVSFAVGVGFLLAAVVVWKKWQE